MAGEKPPPTPIPAEHACDPRWKTPGEKLRPSDAKGIDWERLRRISGVMAQVVCDFITLNEVDEEAQDPKSGLWDAIHLGREAIEEWNKWVASTPVESVRVSAEATAVDRPDERGIPRGRCKFAAASDRHPQCPRPCALRCGHDNPCFCVEHATHGQWMRTASPGLVEAARLVVRKIRSWAQAGIPIDAVGQAWMIDHLESEIEATVTADHGRERATPPVDEATIVRHLREERNALRAIAEKAYELKNALGYVHYATNAEIAKDDGPHVERLVQAENELRDAFEAHPATAADWERIRSDIDKAKEVP
jgi:hypothetical protein